MCYSWAGLEDVPPHSIEGQRADCHPRLQSDSFQGFVLPFRSPPAIAKHETMALTWAVLLGAALRARGVQIYEQAFISPNTTQRCTTQPLIPHCGFPAPCSPTFLAQPMRLSSCTVPMSHLRYFFHQVSQISCTTCLSRKSHVVIKGIFLEQLLSNQQVQTKAKRC